jgi:hypothetical protein
MNKNTRLPTTQTSKKPSSSWAARENPLHLAEYSTFASTESKVFAYYEDRTDDLLQETLWSFIAKRVTDWATLTRLLRKRASERNIWSLVSEGKGLML